jgi:copper homeostasis protein
MSGHEAMAAGQARPRPLLEVIATSAEDAVAAEQGGADRLELVSEMALRGLTPELATFGRIREAVTLPLRVMLRSNGGFGATADEIAALCRDAGALRRAGADQFVFGFLDADGALDRAALDALIAAVAPCPWTLHHAFDHAADARAAWEVARTLPGIDCILTGGLRGDVGTGLATLCARADWQADGPRWLAGGNLAREHLPPLRAAGIVRYHVGRTARRDWSWDAPVAVGEVRRWREALDQGAGVDDGE